jgi:hypothetical protein
MTEREARELLAEIYTVRPRKRYRNTVFELRPDGRLDVYAANLKGTRCVFSHTTPAGAYWLPPDVKEWLASRLGTTKGDQ